MVEVCLPYQEQPFTKGISLHFALKLQEYFYAIVVSI